MAIGDIVSASIASDGWFSTIELSGIASGGNYSNMGFGLYNALTAPKITFSVLSSGFDSGCLPTTYQRTIYGTTGIRKPYPDITVNDESINAGNNLLVKVALSDYIYQNDSNITVNILSGFYFGVGTGNNAATSLSVTNGSTHPYPKVIGNWSWVPFERIIGPSGSLRCVAYHVSAESGRPVRAVQFTVADTSGNSLTGIVTGMSVDFSKNDAVPVPEFIWNYSTATLAQNSRLIGNFTAYPRIGNSGSLLNTASPSFTGLVGIPVQPTPWPAPFEQFCDKNNTYGVTVVVVNSTTGSNASGQAVDFASFNSASPPAAYQNIHSGAKAIMDYNNTNRGRNNIGAGIIYLQSGNHPWVGGTMPTVTSFSPTWCTVSGFPGVDRTLISLTGNVGTNHIGNGAKVKLDNVTIANASVSMFQSFMSGIWTNNCYLNSAGTVTYYVNVVSYQTANQIKTLPEGFQPFTPATYTPTILIRGNQFLSGWNKTSQIYTMLGNSGDLHTANQLTFALDYSLNTMIAPTGVPLIVGYNKMFRRRGATSWLQARQNTITGDRLRDNVAVVNNLIETVNSQQGPLIQIAADLTSASTDNVIIWNNVVVGNRLNLAYNSTGSHSPTRFDWSIKNNISDDNNTKDDTFVGEGGANGLRTGNWPVLYGVANEGNMFIDLSGSAAAGSYGARFVGINCFWPNAITYNPNIYNFAAPKYYSGVAETSGFGNYHYTSGGLAVGFGRTTVLSHDLDGYSRLNQDAIGVFGYPITGSDVITSIVAAVSYNTFGGREARFGKNILPSLYFRS